MRTTLNLDPRAVAVVKSIANREQKTMGEVVSELVLGKVSGAPMEYKNGFPVLPVRVPGAVLTTEDVREIMDREGI